ncbi:two-component regulator propeller domain-containing protein [Kangiella sp. TOML190]|uniref:ligand-binding sensor domain-containing protein n=1 Tax=Kangiella sp. TOML190 TaxID=2931351 RepID=UPI0020409385|nr:two-component regulator propeller domain-containing protein [Kangiella sp. TOML190]
MASNDNARFTRINIQEGLSQTSITDMVQDAQGFMWVATQSGLNRYDGHQFEIFSKQVGDKASLSANYITRLALDKSDNVWVQTLQGLDSINSNDLRIINWQPVIDNYLQQEATADNTYDNTQVTDFRVAADGTLLLLINFETLLRLDPRTKKLENISSFYQAQVKQSITGFLILEHGRLLLNSNSCFYFYSSDLQFERSRCFSDDLYGIIFHSSTLQNNLVLINGMNGFYQYDLTTDQLQFYKVRSSKTQSEVAVSDVLIEGDSYWIATSSGLKQFKPKEGKNSKEYFYDSSDITSLSNNQVTRLVRTKDGVLWIGTSLGLSLLKPYQQFEHLLQQREVKTFELANLATSILVDHAGYLWIGTSSSGVYRYSPDRALLNNFLRFQHTPQERHLGFVRTILEDAHHNIWVLAENGISIKRNNSDQFQTYPFFKFKDLKLDLGFMYDLLQDRHGNFWLGGEEGFYKLKIPIDAAGVPLLKQIEIEDFTHKLPRDYLNTEYGIYSLYEDLQGFIWVGGSNGLLRVNPINLAVEYYYYQSNDSTTISSSDINVIYEDLNGVLWIGTSEGLNRVYYNDDGKIRFKRIGIKDGFSSDYISSIESDEKGFLWISTHRGLVRYHPNNLVPIINYSYEDGLQHNEFYVNSSFHDDEDVLYFGGSNGVSSFKPEEIVAKERVNKLQITKVNQGDLIYPLTSLTNGIKLEKEQPLDIKISNFDFKSSKKLTARYKISSYGNEWQLLANNQFRIHQIERPISITIQQKDVNGQWVMPGISLDIEPKFSLYKLETLKWLLITLLFIVMALMVFFLVQKLRRERKVVDLRLKREKAKQTLLMEEKLSLLHQVEDLQYSLSEQRFLADKIKSELEQKESKDDLTGLFSKAYIRRNIQHELKTIDNSWQDTKQKGIYLGVFSVEIDSFHSIKEQNGHLSANEILKQLADCLRSICYGTDIIVRWEGAAILILSRGISKREQMVLSEKIRNIVAARKFDISNGKKVDITVSIGFTRYPFVDTKFNSKQLNWSKVNFIAETALSVAQSNSMNAWVGVFSNQFTDPSNLDKKLLSELPTLVNNGQLDYVSSIPKSKKIQWD